MADEFTPRRGKNCGTSRYTEAERAKKAAYYQRKKAEIAARNKAWLKANKEYAAQYRKNYAAEHADQAAKGKRRWYEQNRDLVLNRQRLRDNTLTDATVRKSIAVKVRQDGFEFSSKDIPDEAVPALRQLIILQRETRRLKKEVTA